METQALGELLQYGAVGAIAVLSIAALGYMTRRYIRYLEASERRQASNSRRLDRTLRAIDRNQAERHREVMAVLSRPEAHTVIRPPDAPSTGSGQARAATRRQPGQLRTEGQAQ